MPRRLAFVLLTLLLACRGDPAMAAPMHRAVRASDRDTIPDSIGKAIRDSIRARMPAARRVQPDTGIVRALYVNRWASHKAERMRRLIAIADSTEINALVIDMKDEFGLNYASRDAMVRKLAGNAGRVARLAELLDTLHAHHILAIARVVAFKDSVAARADPQHVIRQPDGQPWHDRKGLTWVDPYDRRIWEYDIRAAVELGQAGFDEIQFDYIRFPEPYKSLPPQVFADAKGRPKPQALAEFLRAACPRIHATGARCTADIFGMVASLPGPLEVGQQWSLLAPAADALLPMVYPSHYPSGAFGVPHPNAEPYTVVRGALTNAREQDARLGIALTNHVRPWLQAFTLGAPHYGAAQVEAQKRAVYDAGYDSWLLWHPGSEYDAVLGALEKTTVSRRKVPGSAPAGTR